MKNLRIQGSSDILGLNDKEVQERVEKGQVNILPKTPSRTISQIIKANVFTLFNLFSTLHSIKLYIFFQIRIMQRHEISWKKL